MAVPLVPLASSSCSFFSPCTHNTTTTAHRCCVVTVIITTTNTPPSMRIRTHDVDERQRRQHFNVKLYWPDGFAAKCLVFSCAIVNKCKCEKLWKVPDIIRVLKVCNFAFRAVCELSHVGHLFGRVCFVCLIAGNRCFLFLIFANIPRCLLRGAWVCLYVIWCAFLFAGITTEEEPLMWWTDAPDVGFFLWKYWNDCFFRTSNVKWKTDRPWCFVYFSLKQQEGKHCHPSRVCCGQ